ncbi:hypothetical protein EDB89DRAFT_73832 [Lactarius sanguifluus]|nr:hypothetical protein EDB89DRAFT_73832 [Lactarius sanguifluus]
MVCAHEVDWSQISDSFVDFKTGFVSQASWVWSDVQEIYWLSSRISSLSTKELEAHAIYALNLLCNTEASNPEFKSYDGAQAIVEWSAPSGCSFRSVAPAEGGDDKPERGVEAVGSAIGWFFLLFVPN